MQNNTLIAPLVLVGAGHAHLVSLRQWIAHDYRAPAGSVLITPTSYAWYSGMMPGLLAARFQAEQCRVELEPLCAACGIELVGSELRTLDASNGSLQLADGRTVQFQTLSLNTGAMTPSITHDESLPLISPKPFPGFIQHWQGWLLLQPQRLAIVGDGAAGFELAMALRASLPGTKLEMFCREELLANHPLRLRRLARARLQKVKILLHEHQQVDAVVNGQLYSCAAPVAQPEAVILATGTSAPEWQRRSGLDCDAEGFIRINPHLQSLSHPSVFATGDCASLPNTPHSGVYAVRQGAVLADNLKAHLAGRPLQKYQPQPTALALLSCADGTALLCYGPLAVEGLLAGRLKDWLDLRFIRG